MRVLITGGAGFIGSHLADALLQAGHQVRVLDSLDPQIHGESPGRPKRLDRRVDLRVGDVRDARAVRRALSGVDLVFHLAARVGAGPSIGQPAEFASVNTAGTSVLLEELAASPVRRLILASSMSVYGEGRALDRRGGAVDPPCRSPEQLRRNQWEVRSADGSDVRPAPTPESKKPMISSVYALTKFDQERLCMMFGAAHHIPTVALRLANVYGPRQPLSGPGAGALANFATRLMSGEPPVIFEDGQQQRDFVCVHDVTRACVQAMEAPGVDGRAINIGSGAGVTIWRLASELSAALRRDVAPTITQQHREGDVRHCFADISLARDLLRYRPRISRSEGLSEFANWLQRRAAEQRRERQASVRVAVAAASQVVAPDAPVRLVERAPARAVEVV